MREVKPEQLLPGIMGEDLLYDFVEAIERCDFIVLEEEGSGSYL